MGSCASAAVPQQPNVKYIDVPVPDDTPVHTTVFLNMIYNGMWKTALSFVSNFSIDYSNPYESKEGRASIVDHIMVKFDSKNAHYLEVLHAVILKTPRTILNAPFGSTLDNILTLALIRSRYTLDVVKWLIDSGVNVYHKNKSGQDALWLAISIVHDDTLANYLLTHICERRNGVFKAITDTTTETTTIISVTRKPIDHIVTSSAPALPIAMATAVITHAPKHPTKHSRNIAYTQLPPCAD